MGAGLLIATLALAACAVPLDDDPTDDDDATGDDDTTPTPVVTLSLPWDPAMATAASSWLVLAGPGTHDRLEMSTAQLPGPVDAPVPILEMNLYPGRTWRAWLALSSMSSLRLTDLPPDGTLAETTTRVVELGTILSGEGGEYGGVWTEPSHEHRCPGAVPAGWWSGIHGDLEYEKPGWT